MHCVEAVGGACFDELADHLRAAARGSQPRAAGRVRRRCVLLLGGDRGQVGWRVLWVAVAGEPQDRQPGGDRRRIVAGYDTGWKRGAALCRAAASASCADSR